MNTNEELQKALELQLAGQRAEARSRYSHILDIHPNDVSALHQLGRLDLMQGESESAIKVLQRCVELAPQHVDAQYALGWGYARCGKWEDATVALQRAVALRPDFASAHCDLGVALLMQKRADEAIAAFCRTLALNPAHPVANNNLGALLLDQGKVNESIIALQRAVSHDPNYADAYRNLGQALSAQGRITEALAMLERATTLNPAHAYAQFHTGLLQLLTGNFVEGWKKYEFRWAADPRGPRAFDVPLWCGDRDLAGKTILLHAEQGLGDTLQYVRYLPLVSARGATIYLEIQKALKPLFDASPLVARVFARGETLPHFDFHCPLLSLPLAFRTDLHTIPSTVPYLQPPISLIDQWTPKLRTKYGLRVGVVWAGNSLHRNDRNRSIPLNTFEPLLNVSGCHFVVVQKDMGDADRARLASMPMATDLSHALRDFSDTAAIVKQLDLVITVDTSVAHLAGALAIPTWILLPFAPDCRWLLDREDSPWYPTVRLFRQNQIADWSGVIDRVKQHLTTLAQSAKIDTGYEPSVTDGASSAPDLRSGTGDANM